MLTVHVIDQADAPVAEIRPIQASAAHYLMDEGGWEVVTRGDRDLWKTIRQANDYWVLIYDTSSQRVHGGPIRDRRWKGTEDDGVIILSGGNANWYANTTVTLPVHTQTNYPGASAPRTQRGYSITATQHGSASIYELVDDQHNNTGLTYRDRDLSLTLASLVDTGFEPTSIEAEPFENLLETVRRWGLATGIIADFQWKGETTTAELVTRLPQLKEFRLWRQDGTDVDWEWYETADTLTHAWVGGQGVGVDRAVSPIAAPTGIAPSWGINIERFVGGGATDDAELIELGHIKIAGSAAQAGMKTKTLIGEGLEYGTDYELGDIAPVGFLGVEYFKVITGVEIEWSSAGKVEQIEVGEPELAIYNQPDVVLGEQAAVEYLPTAGLTVGNLRLVDIYTEGDGSVRFAVELVYVEADGTIADQAGITIEYRVDGGAWVTDVDDLKTGNLDYYYDLDTWTFSRNVPAFTATLEYRASLAKTGETSVFTPILLLATDDVAPGDPFESTFNTNF